MHTRDNQITTIVAELRRGMDDTTPFADNHPGQAGEISAALRKASASSDVLGRCGGSLRGKLCKLLAKFALPVVEQINTHNSAVTDALNQISNTQIQQLEERIATLEQELQKLKSGKQN
jgi:uncharacterized small protein (DUF1192 family)